VATAAALADVGAAKEVQAAVERAEEARAAVVRAEAVVEVEGWADAAKEEVLSVAAATVAAAWVAAMRGEEAEEVRWAVMVEAAARVAATVPAAAVVEKAA
jgi:hypothetical protein